MTLLSISVNPEDRKMGRPERMRQPLPHKLTKGLGGGSTELSISLSSADLTPYPQVPKFLLANRFLFFFFNMLFVFVIWGTLLSQCLNICPWPATTVILRDTTTLIWGIWYCDCDGS